MDVSQYMYTEIVSAIIISIKQSDDWQETVGWVHLLDHWEELKDEASAKNSKEIQRWMEQQKLLEEGETKSIFLFHKIKDVLKEHGLEWDIESQFHLVCDIAEVFEKEMEERNASKNNE